MNGPPPPKILANPNPNPKPTQNLNPDKNPATSKDSFAHEPTPFFDSPFPFPVFSPLPAARPSDPPTPNPQISPAANPESKSPPLRLKPGDPKLAVFGASLSLVLLALLLRLFFSWRFSARRAKNESEGARRALTSKSTLRAKSNWEWREKLSARRRVAFDDSVENLTEMSVRSPRAKMKANW